MDCLTNVMPACIALGMTADLDDDGDGVPDAMIYILLIRDIRLTQTATGCLMHGKKILV
ncbi:MAG: hypothetical protein CM15mP51_24830 [Porticoccaceae bacterium]|nr:MAG: hypothetical protein CM15mP51_24830 [Porticoccaceae bacterium]